MMKFDHILLASKSPRRKELMEDCPLPFRVEIVETEEVYNEALSPQDAIMDIALQKAKAVASKFPDELVLGCDTMVLIDDVPLGKPKDKADANAMLHRLCGKTHRVISGVALVCNENRHLFYEETEVTFYEADEAFLTQYVDSEEPYDKAGAYGIQGVGKLLVKEIHGDFYNVMGLPIARICRELKKL